MSWRPCTSIEIFSMTLGRAGIYVYKLIESMLSVIKVIQLLIDHSERRRMNMPEQIRLMPRIGNIELAPDVRKLADVADLNPFPRRRTARIMDIEANPVSYTHLTLPTILRV